MTYPSSEELKEELLARCKKLLDERGKDGLDSRSMPPIGKITICIADGDLYVDIKSDIDKSVVYDGFYDLFFPELAESVVLPALRKLMVLDDLASS